MRRIPKYIWKEMSDLIGCTFKEIITFKRLLSVPVWWCLITDVDDDDEDGDDVEEEKKKSFFHSKASR